MTDIAFATDNQLQSIARTKANYDFSNSPKRVREHNFATAIPMMDSFLTGAATKGSLKTKVLTGGNQLKDWGIFLAVTSLYNKAIDKIVEKSDTLQNFKENSPFAYGIANTALGVTTGISGIHYVNKGYQKFIAPHIPQKLKTFASNIIGTTDSSSIGKSINNGMKTFAKNYPKTTKGLSTLAKWTMPILCLAFMTSMAIDAIKAKTNEKKLYNKLVDARLQSAQNMALQSEAA